MSTFNSPIPKMIHYCWFGGKPLPELAEKCIASWKKFLPDYEIKEWNESNFNLDSCNYIREAYDAEMWAFVSDYARFKILYEMGGVYFDTDVELIKPIEDILESGSFMGSEAPSPDKRTEVKILINSGLGLAAVPGLTLYKDILNSYENSHFIDSNGLQDVTTVVTRITDIIIQCGYDVRKEGIQVVNNINIYPPDFFCPLNYYTGKLTVTENTRSIHHYSETWHTPIEKKVEDWRRKYAQKGQSNTILEKITIYPLIITGSIQKYGIIKTLKLIISKMKP